ncbi:MAG TPA: undecaprenyldiphospho-muramoylpentapeptide beta-N-acetylglucosaminyltransferase [Candidatus Polarisedimenticolia bacterium]|nr:undecaprenyldiphospho-muramoylpentapeptide beta-N-acetylglucosaminyltransferase [Candidatus Polarisedimenticolia bacterium]
MPTVLVAGGGTGGHIFPGVAIARELVERVAGCEVLFAGTRRGLESRIVPAEGFRLVTIRSAGITGKRALSRLKGLALVPVSLAQSVALVARLRPDLVIGVGGYSSGPVLASAVALRVPTLIHEQNYVPGLTNRWLAPFVTEVAVTFEETIPRLKGRGVVTGNPVRRHFALIGPRPAGAVPARLLVFGGSQGARAVNRAMAQALPLLAPLRGRLAILHQTGESALEEMRSAYRAAGFTEQEAEARPFISGMSQAFEDADLIVSRSGATTVAELTAAGRPAILVPFAGAAHDHQTFNARKLEQAGAAVVIAESEMSGQRLGAAIVELLGDPARLARMGAASRAAGRPDAAARIADLCLPLIASRRGRAA